MRAPRLLFAAPASSSGKTTVSLLFNAWARRQGLAPRAYKAGPDFIDPQYLSLVSGRPAYNLDPWFLGPPALRRHFAETASPNLNVVEGVMGLFDGKRGAAFGRHSSAELARTLDLPVVLVLNARKAGPTLATQALGLMKADPRVRYAGVVLNQVASEKTVRLIAPALRKLCGLPVLGWLPTLAGLSLPERHLGLTAPQEMAGWQKKFEDCLGEAEKTLDFKLLFKAASRAPSLAAAVTRTVKKGPRFGLAIARDEAFHFYYQANLDLFESLGAELLPFSPLRDQALPAGAQGLLLGGGFPESFVPALSKNKSLRAQVLKRLREGMPVWAECGGLMWLAKRLDGGAMVGALAGDVNMTKGLQNFGYTQALPLAKLWGASLAPIKGHEFHHSEFRVSGKMRAQLSLEQTARPSRREGWALPGGLATYFHAYLPSQPAWARAFAEACRA